MAGAAAPVDQLTSGPPEAGSERWSVSRIPADTLSSHATGSGPTTARSMSAVAAPSAGEAAGTNASAADSKQIVAAAEKISVLAWRVLSVVPRLRCLAFIPHTPRTSIFPDRSGKVNHTQYRGAVGWMH